ncbi:hypothetical protein LPB86_12085 [Pedobacter sp. MC2016-14]|uniref:glycoside hydrolase family 2 TIM barrel-domain containing protein n=1 Tax=Pedobacter sp. MC2016-14 TaxID=2897327 RepID=UPI001E31BD61|nr:glycoside hydrolase family 2 TIM barrel-domain containing protein [Pedobacter sp. MC2016-14]MCD0488970.1 hypothetical protein [Pedobacter sp. MC2016-14]
MSLKKLILWLLLGVALPGAAQDSLSLSVKSWQKKTASGGIPTDTANSLWYQQTVLIPQTWQNKRVILNFRRIEGDAIIYVNEVRVAELLRPGGEVDLSSHINFGVKNSLKIVVTRDYSGISRDFKSDVLRYLSRQALGNTIPQQKWGLGITASAILMARNPQAVTDVFCISSFRKKTLTLQVEIDALKPLTGSRLEAIIYDKDGKEALKLTSSELEMVKGKAVYSFTADWKNPVYWELEKPYLYKASVVLLSKSKKLDSHPPVTFGFRELWTQGKDLYMNGHPSRWRLTDIYGTGKNGLGLYKLMGYNVAQIQPHSNLWWRAQAETPLLDEELLDEMDRIGMGCTVPAPSINSLRTALVSNPKVLEAYRKEMEYYMRWYRNHPSIMAWVVGMNSYNPKSNIAANTMGKRDTVLIGQAKVISLACAVVKDLDPTRLAYSHADGSIGDLSSANVYLNFIPLQEREEWPSEWASHGNMPFSAVEFGPPYWNNFWKGNQFLLTEYLAMYQGEAAYYTEGIKGLDSTISRSLNPVSATWEQMDFTQYPKFWDFQRLFAKNTNRSWRSWGVNGGWMNWLLEGYGTPPDNKSPRYSNRYKYLKDPVLTKPVWVNERFEIFKQANQPLLVYIGGFPIHTDKTHQYYSGETINKQISIVWDGVEQLVLDAEWQFLSGEKVLLNGAEKIKLKAGEIRQVPFQMKAPIVSAKTTCHLVLKVKQPGEPDLLDTLQLTLFPAIEKPGELKGLALYDPLGKSKTILDGMGLKLPVWAKNMGLTGIKTLIIGEQSLQAGEDLPYSSADIAAGLKVIILAQQPDVWQGMGFETAENMSRYVFIRDSLSKVLKGLGNADLCNWRGTPLLLPEGKLAMEYDQEHAPKWTNTNAVASSVLKIPDVVGFRPILQAEFDLAYSPLMEFRHGKGAITFCSIDLEGRQHEPAAVLLIRNLITNASMALPAQRRVVYSGDTLGLIQLKKLGISPLSSKTLQSGDLLVLGNGNVDFSVSQLNHFVNNGGLVLHFPQTAAQLLEQGFKANPKRVLKVSQPPANGILRGLSANLWRWRDALDVIAFATTDQPAGVKVSADGLIAEQAIGKGVKYYLQVGPELLSSKYTEDPKKREALQLSVTRLQQLQAGLLNNLQAIPDPVIAGRLEKINPRPTFQTLGSWRVLGPYLVPGLNGEKLPGLQLPGQQDAIEGGQNPNLTYKRTDGVTLDWRTTVQADQTGFVNLGKAFSGIDENAVAFVTRSITTKSAQNAILRFGVDYWMEGWLNGRPIVQIIKTHHKRASEVSLRVPLKAGENILTLKIGSGKGGFGFWADISYEENAAAAAAVSETATVDFYRPLYKNFDPYQFTYW